MKISLVIPTLNEEAILAETLRQARTEKPEEIIVVDGGSVDRTRERASDADCYLTAPRGRARQMNAGAAIAKGEMLLFLHADCRLEPGALAEAERMLRTPGIVAGCFRQSVDADHWLYRCIDACATARTRWTGIAYGDQALFVRRETFDSIGGFPDVPFLEDLMICRRLRQFGRLAVASKRVYTSPRRWRNAGIVRQTLRNWTLTALAACGVTPQYLDRYYPAVR